ncbi:MAG: hypothetical protein NC933_02280, partial [Candidatus Omnitrophica bacterium]|nr:hypothetical protein [Candidatus Omnitrophota bacterium]
MLKGFLRVFHPPRLGYGLYGKIKDSILIITSECGYPSGKCSYKTKYVDTADDDALLVIGPVQHCGANAKPFVPISAFCALRIMGIMMCCGVEAFFKIPGKLYSKILILLEWCSWVFSMQWLRNLYLERILSEITEQYPIKKIGCIHEMHSYARVVWRFASKRKIRTYTIQHASVSSDKRWYFPYPEEIAQGLMLPDVFYAFERRVVDLLAPYFPNTTFLMGCSCRYKEWKSVEPGPVDQ